jgi:hypothetical protein
MYQPIAMARNHHGQSQWQQQHSIQPLLRQLVRMERKSLMSSFTGQSACVHATISPIKISKHFRITQLMKVIHIDHT